MLWYKSCPSGSLETAFEQGCQSQFHPRSHDPHGCPPTVRFYKCIYSLFLSYIITSATWNRAMKMLSDTLSLMEVVGLYVCKLLCKQMCILCPSPGDELYLLLFLIPTFANKLTDMSAELKASACDRDLCLYSSLSFIAWLQMEWPKNLQNCCAHHILTWIGSLTWRRVSMETGCSFCLLH